MQSLDTFLSILIVSLVCIVFIVFILVLFYLRQRSSTALNRYSSFTSRSYSRGQSYSPLTINFIERKSDWPSAIPPPPPPPLSSNTSWNKATSQRRSIMSTASSSIINGSTKNFTKLNFNTEDDQIKIAIEKKQTKEAAEQKGVFMSENPTKRPIRLNQFEKYYQQIKANNYWRLEFEQLREVCEKTLYNNQPQVSYTSGKDKFRDILPYKHSLVELKGKEDYINASFIAGDAGPREYISTQSPMADTKLDFFRMLLQYKVDIIVTLNSLVERNCIMYFPILLNDPDLIEIDGRYFRVELVEKQEPSLDLKINVIHFIDSTTNEIVLAVKQFHFQGWRDFDTPSQTVLDLIEAVRLCRYSLPNHGVNHPVVVHCSAGVGRTGVYIALDQIWHRITIALMNINRAASPSTDEVDKKNNSRTRSSSPKRRSRSISKTDKNEDDTEPMVDIFGTVYQMRMYRRGMVQTERQYEFLYDTVELILRNKRLIRYNGTMSTASLLVNNEDTGQ